jgi:hypothetical protein
MAAAKSPLSEIAIIMRLAKARCGLMDFSASSTALGEPRLLSEVLRASKLDGT